MSGFIRPKIRFWFASRIQRVKRFIRNVILRRQASYIGAQNELRRYEDFQGEVDAKLRYLLNEVSDLRVLMRYLLPESENYQRFVQETNASFDYQWKNLDSGLHLLTDPAFQENAASLVEEYTGLSRDWFEGRKVLDAGCGNGRWSWVLCKLGAKVVAIDQSISGVEAAREACSSFPNFTAKQQDLLEDIGMPGEFDFVWAYGLVHHTGNTWRAIRQIAECVRPSGYLFMMIYGEPRWDQLVDFIEVNNYVELRRKLATMDLDERVEYLRRSKKEELVHAWFDTASPRINDLHRFDEVYEWLRMLGFTNIHLTLPRRNLHLMAQRLQ